MNFSINSAVTLFTLMTSSLVGIEAIADDRNYFCEIENNQGTATVKLLNVENHPEIKLLDIKIKVKPLRKVEGQQGDGEFAYLEGLFATKVRQNKNIAISGLLSTHKESQIRLPRLTLTLQGELSDEDNFYLSLYDDKRILHHGFGTGMLCTQVF